MDVDPADKQRRWWHMQLDARGAASGVAIDGLSMRSIVETDLDAIAQLMLDAYEGTIDSEGETIVEAREEVGGWFDSDWPDAVCSHVSTIASDRDGTVQCAVLVSPWESNEVLIGYVITSPEAKGRGLGRALVERTLELLPAHAITTVRAAITVGNSPSERLFDRAGFTAGSFIVPD
ncbi:MAG: GNAT family N-acetyltransferase [Ilumatobacteraceae bacterium]